MEYKISISSWSKEKLEDQYLRLYDDYLTLKKHACKQEERIKKMATKILRLASDKNDTEPGAVWKEDYQEQIEVLERKNEALTRKLTLVQNQLNVQKQRVGSAPLSARKASSVNVQTTNRNSVIDEKSINNSNAIQTLRFQNSALEKTIQKLSEQLKERDELIGQLKGELQSKEQAHTHDLFALGEQVTSKQRVALQENIDLIRTQRELREKQMLITSLEARIREAESNYEITKTTNRQLVSEVERLSRESSQLEQKLFRVESDSNAASKLQLKILELQYAYDDAKRENEALKESNEKLLTNAFAIKSDQNWTMKEQKLRGQIDHLEIMVHNLQQQLKEQEEMKRKQQNSSDFPVEEQILSSKQQSNQLQSVPIRQDNKSNSYEQPPVTHMFAQITGFDVEELEDAIMILRERKSKSQSVNENMNFAESYPLEQNKDSLKQLSEAEALHAETITELEKTRKLLSVQYKINKDYQSEIKELTERLTDLKAESEQRLHEYAKLLDIRAVRIQQLEKQIRDLAYGSNKRKAVPGDHLSSDIISTDDALKPGESLIELHIGRLYLFSSVLQKLQIDHSLAEQSIRLFLTWDFYDFETQATPIIIGDSVDLNITIQYPVEVNDTLMNYLLKEPCTLEMHQVTNSTYRTIAVGKLDFSQLFTSKDEGLETYGQGAVIRRQGQLDLFLIPTVDIHYDTQDDGKDRIQMKLGTLDYWIRLCAPMQDSLKLYKERFRQLPGSSTLSKSTVHDTLSGTTSLNNTLTIEIIKITNLVYKQQNGLLQPSLYFVYQFYDEPEYDSPIIKQNISPVFNDCHRIEIKMNDQLDSYLRSESLKIYILDSSAPDPEKSCLGVAVVPLIGLIHNKQQIDGVFEIFPPSILLQWQQSNRPEQVTNQMRSSSTGCGLLHLKIYWSQPYITECTQTGVYNQPSVKMSKDLEIEPVKQAAEKPYKSFEQSNKEINSTSITSSFTSPTDLSSNHYSFNTPSQSTPLKNQPPANLEPVKEELIEKVSRVRVNQVSNPPADYSLSKKKTETVSSVQVASQNTSDKPSVPTPHPRTRTTEFHDTKADTLNSTLTSGVKENELQMIALKQQSNNNNLQNSEQNPIIQSSTDDNQVKIELHGLHLTDLSKIPNNQIPSQIFVEYSFLGYKEPFETGSYPLTEWMDNGRKILKSNFYYSKTFPVDFTNNYEQRQYLASLLLPQDPNNGKLVFVIVAEPSTMQSASSECEEVGYAVINIRQMVKDNSLIDHAFIPITSAKDVNDKAENTH
uniref:C2 domain-containing protein n=1 Tax=Trichobilharzia regenti TaxID=157069 RepID=A0AA85J0F7_TRIRE